jgi:hypothetical protein
LKSLEELYRKLLRKMKLFDDYAIFIDEGEGRDDVVFMIEAKNMEF